MTRWHRVGASSVFVPPLGIGTANFGREVDEKAAFKILDAAFSCGIRLIDTAELYPHPTSVEKLGVAETLIGKWIKTKPRDSLVISTKFSGPAIGSYTTPARGGNPGLDGASVRRAIEGSLTRLGTEYIDLVQPHWPDNYGNPDSMLYALSALSTEGKIRVFGGCNQTPWGLMRLLWRSETIGTLRPEFTQQRHNLICSGADHSLNEVLVQEEVGMIAYETLAGGVLTGKYSENGKVESQPPQNRMQDGRIEPLQSKLYFSNRAKAITRAVKDVALQHGIAPAGLALAATCRNQFCTSTLVGARHSGQIDEIANVLDENVFSRPIHDLANLLNSIPPTTP